MNRLLKTIRLAAAAALLLPGLAKGTTNELKMELKSVKRLRVTTTMEASSTLQKTEQDGRDAYGRIVLAPSYLIGKDYRAGASGSIKQNLNEEEKTVYGNTRVNISRKPLQLTQDTSIVLVAGGRLPTNPDDHRDNTFNGSVLVDPSLITEWNILGKRFTTTYELTLSKNFHTYDRNNKSEANMSYTAISYFGIETYILDNVVLTLDGDYTYGRSYQDTPKTAYSIGQSVTYEQPKWSLTVGHTNSANALQANGRDHNISTFDKHTSAIYSLLRIVY